MSLDALFPLFRESWILYRDPGVIVVDKPWGVPTHEVTAGDVNHVVARLAAFLKARGERDYLGIHQRLDKDTSGVLLFTNAPECNRAIAMEMEQRRAEKHYTAAVILPKGAPQKGTLRGYLLKEKGGTVAVYSKKPKNPAAQEAITHYRVIERRGDRALLHVELETGRMHQIRAQFAHAGFPVAGDTFYEGPPAVRLMLHASHLRLNHPSGKGKIDVRSNPPAEFERWLLNAAQLPQTAVEIELRLRAAAEKRAGIYNETGPDGERLTTAFRLANGAGDDLPGIEVDLYQSHLVVSLVSPEAEALKDAILDAAQALGAEGVYLKVRPKHASVLSPAERQLRTPSHAVRGKDAPPEFLVKENGLGFWVRLGDGLQTGLFLDQRDNRKRVREVSGGLSVLNLFAYTGAFTVAAAAGGALKTTTVDVAAGVLERARKNLDYMGAAAADHTLIDMDAVAYLKGAQKRGERYDLVILDPPSFATTKSSTFSAKDHLGDVIALAIRVTAGGGRLLVSTNHKGIGRMRLRRTIHEAARDAGRDLWQVKDLPGTVDFPPDPLGESPMKSVLVTVSNV